MPRAGRAHAPRWSLDFTVPTHVEDVGHSERNLLRVVKDTQLGITRGSSSARAPGSSRCLVGVSGPAPRFLRGGAVVQEAGLALVLACAAVITHYRQAGIQVVNAAPHGTTRAFDRRGETHPGRIVRVVDIAGPSEHRCRRAGSWRSISSVKRTIPEGARRRGPRPNRSRCARRVTSASAVRWPRQGNFSRAAMRLATSAGTVSRTVIMTSTVTGSMTRRHSGAGREYGSRPSNAVGTRPEIVRLLYS